MTRPFSLAGLLRVRSLQERTAAEHLSRASLDRSHTAARERTLRTALANSPDSVTDVRTLEAVAASRVASRRALADLALLASTQDEQLARAQEAYASARIEQHGLTRLAEQHDRRERAAELAAEQAELDEIAIRPRTEEHL